MQSKKFPKASAIDKEKMKNKHLVALELLSALKQQNDTKPRKGKQTIEKKKEKRKNVKESQGTESCAGQGSQGSETGNAESDSEEEPRKGRKKGVATGRPTPLATLTARKPSKRGGQTGEKRARHVAEGSFEEVTIKGHGMRVRGVPDDSTDDEDTIFYEQPPPQEQTRTRRVGK